MSKLWLTLVTAMCCSGVMCQIPSDNPASVYSERNIPPHFLHFNVNDRNGTAILRWAAFPVNPDDYYIVEKSTDGVHFEIMSAIGSNSAMVDSSFSATDNAVGNGMVYYRIRISGENGNPVYSKTLSMSVNLAGDFKFYPNPVDKLLIVRSSHPLAIQVMDAYGMVWFNQDIGAGMQIVNVSTLQKGNYILKAKDKVTNTLISEQLIKN